MLRAVVAALPAHVAGIRWAGIFFVERSELVLGPEAGDPDESARIGMPIDYRGDRVGALKIDGQASLGLLERIAVLVSAQVLLGWDTAGEPWEP